jgi:hypothetical protein
MRVGWGGVGWGALIGKYIRGALIEKYIIYFSINAPHPTLI